MPSRYHAHSEIIFPFIRWPWQNRVMSNLQLAVQLFFQVAVILAFCQIVGRIAQRLGQPQVVAEMIAGVLLGPSLFGLLWPELSLKLFPADSM